jgi:hypothetical protein
VPAAIAHYLLALKALEKYQKDQKENEISVQKDAYLWGVQGPDFLFYDLPFPWKHGKSLNILGRVLHKSNPTNLLSCMQVYAVDHKSDNSVLSYFLGFLCHYSLDRTVHPYIYFQIQSLRKKYPHCSDAFLHCQIESALDVILLRHETGEIPTEFNLKKTVPKNKDVMNMIAVLYSSLLQSLFSKKIPEKSVLRAEHICRFTAGLQNDRTGLKKLLFTNYEKKHSKFLCSCFFRGILESDDFDYANILESPWKWPLESGRMRNESFFSLFESACSESVQFMKEIFYEKDFEKMTRGIPFS